MEIRPITPRYAVSPQIEPHDIVEIAAAGYTTILCNRPDGEIPAELQADVIRAATEAAGLTFKELPLTHDTIEAVVAAQMQIVETAPGPVFAYCASGTRCTIVWALGQVGRMSAEDIVAAAQSAGYDLSSMASRLDPA